MKISSVLRRVFSVGVPVAGLLLVNMVAAFAANSAGGGGAAGAAGANYGDGGVSNAVDNIKNNFFVPIVTSIAGLAFVGSTVGMMFRPDKKELLSHVAAISLTGLVAIGGGVAVMGAMRAMSTASGVLIR